MKKNYHYEEIEHTADIAIRVRAIFRVHRRAIAGWRQSGGQGKSKIEWVVNRR